MKVRRPMTVSPLWLQGSILTFVIGFWLLAFAAIQIYQDQAPIPERIVDEAGKVLFTRQQILNGQQQFLTGWHETEERQVRFVPPASVALTPAQRVTAWFFLVVAALFLASVGFWNFLGAGVFGFLINLPVVSYYEIGTLLTSNHGHAAFMGVYGMLALALLVFCTRYLARPEDWSEGLVRFSFWATNIGLMLIILGHLFPLGFFQLGDVVTNGYWHARTEWFRNYPWLSWARMPGDLEFLARAHFHRAQRNAHNGFAYDVELDRYECPQGELLTLPTFDDRNKLAIYKASASSCNECVLKAFCTPHAGGRHVYRSLAEFHATDVGRFNRWLSQIVLAVALAFSVGGLLAWWNKPGEWLLAIATGVSLLLLWLDLRDDLNSEEFRKPISAESQI
jgi:hypothetical protein